ncbi:unnamed protein product [Brassicogethes aeneus]|uniref:acylglycerol lipase n=1 Tax=Brassicogethes aeneus TaxID=1431903 RepID=A0A9P0BD38_BRAAE|nr:unnamed protein product [Brassicogethes aeneus]
MTEEFYTNIGCVPKVVSTWRSFVSSLKFGHQVHPLDPIPPEDSEFIVIDSKFNIRVIHIKPSEKKRPPPVLRESFKRNSLSEEYWFTKWNRPLKIGNCNCSFRRSMRYSIITNQPSKVNSEKSALNLDKPTKIINVETFVDRLIQETFFESFQEYYMSLSNKTSGKVNLAYDITEEEFGVTLRKKNYHDVEKKQCVHKKSHKKPLILLLHGIGMSADVWQILIDTLVNKGFEVIAPDLLGHGFSSAPDMESLYTFESLLLQLITIFDHYMIDKKKCIVIGHSYGCSLSTALYQHRSSQISQMILISGGGPTPLAAPVGDGEISPFGCVYTLFRPLLFCGLKRSFFYSSRGKHFSPCDNDGSIPSHVINYIAKGQQWPQGDAAFHRRILVPTLLVHGLQDQKVTLVQECEMERTIPRAFLELIPNAGHMSMLETPEHLTHMVICFLDWWTQ